MLFVRDHDHGIKIKYSARADSVIYVRGLPLNFSSALQ